MKPNSVFSRSYGDQVPNQQAKLSGRLARWIVLLEEFDYTMEYKLGRMHLQAYHLSRLFKEVGTSPIDDTFIDDNLFVIIAILD